jgi:hypothetical protein
MAIAPNTLRPGELPEFPFKGPWGGVISDQPAHVIEQFGGFTQAQNVMFRKGQAVVRPTLSSLPAIPSPSSSISLREPVLGVGDFFDANGDRHQMVMTPTRLLEWISGGWTNVPSASSVLPGLTGGVNDHFTWTVVGEKFCFCQGADPVQLWDGITSTFGAASADAVPARYLMELIGYLIAMNTVEAGGVAPQRVRWTAPGDPTTWTGLTAGQTDLFNAFGPINNGFKLYQSAFILQQFGFTMVQPTGNGLAPFSFVPLVATRGRGLAIPLSAASDGESLIAYVGKDNVYVFDGTQSTPIGDQSISNYTMAGSRVRIGARYAIFADLLAADITQVLGFVSTSIGGNPYNAYWLFIPNVGTWVYNFDEQNWTKFSWSDVQPCACGSFFEQTVIRIMDLIGPISAQTWTPATLIGTNPYDAMFIAFRTNGPAAINFAGTCEQSWSLSGQWQMGDFRHDKTLSKIRLVAVDSGATSFSISISNNRGQSIPPINVSFGSGSGVSVELIIPVPGKLNGMFFTWQIAGAAGEPLAMSEFTPIYDIGGEYRGV